MSGKIFLNYRRGDDPGSTGRLYDRLEGEFEPGQLFMDVEGHIRGGDDFVDVLKAHVAQCDILLAVIGPRWLDINDEYGRRRLDSPEDWVRIEIASALESGKRVIPVLIGDARIPRADDLPDALKPLARRQIIRITLERFKTDTQGLVSQIKLALAELERTRSAAAAAAREAARPEPAPSITSALFDLDQLHPSVKTVVFQARANSRIAEHRANEARQRAEEARRVAARAGKDPGTWGGLIDGGLGWYNGQLQSNKYHGLGTFLFAKDDQNGNDYAGEFAVGKYDGLGVIAYASNPNNSGELNLYEGEFTRGLYSGYGIFTWKSGSTYAGSVDDTGKSGSGVNKWSDGARYEGEYVSNVRQGIGVIWNGDGTVRFAGRWNKDELAETILK